MDTSAALARIAPSRTNAMTDRAIELHWPNPLPTSELDPLEEAAAKEKLGISSATVLREIGY